MWRMRTLLEYSECDVLWSQFLAPPPPPDPLFLLLMSSAIAYMDPLIHQDYQHLFKCLLLGNSGCGKSSLVDRFVDPQHVLRTNYISTIGVDFKVQTFLWDNQVVKLQVSESLPSFLHMNLMQYRSGIRLDKKDFDLLWILIIVVPMASYLFMT